MRQRLARLAVDLGSRVRNARDRVARLFTPFRQPGNGGGHPSFGGLSGLGGALSLDGLGFRDFLDKIGDFNPLCVEPFIQRLMHRSVMPRLAHVLLSSALAERRYVIEGADPDVEQFHQRWLDQLIPGIHRAAANAVWYGWQPYIIEWAMVEGGHVVPHHARDVDPFLAEALECEETRVFRGLRIEGKDFGLDRAFKLTWMGDWGNHYGQPQALSVYPFWWAHSVLLVWAMRYYERSVDPVRIAFAKDVQVPTGKLNSDGSREYVDLTEVVAEALDVAGNGDSVALPVGKEGEELVKLDQLDLPDRSDTLLKMLSYLEQKMFLGYLSMPGLGVSAGYGDLSAADARTAEKLQLRVLEFVTDMPIEPLQELLLRVHRTNRLPGPPPRVRGKAFKREQHETLRELVRAGLMQPLPEVGPDGRPSGRSYRVADLIRWDALAQQLDLPLNSISEVARAASELEPQAPGVGGRPPEPLAVPDIPGDEVPGEVSRAEARAQGRDR